MGKKTAKRAVAVSSNVCDLSYCDAPVPTSNDADLPTLSTDFVPSTCVIGMLESEMEQFSDLLQATIRQVFGSLTETQMERPAWASNPGDSCRDGSNEHWRENQFPKPLFSCSRVLEQRVEHVGSHPKAVSDGTRLSVCSQLPVPVWRTYKPVFLWASTFWSPQEHNNLITHCFQ